MIVDGFNALLRAAVSGYAGLFGFADPLVGLAVASLLIGIGMLWVVGKTSNQRAIERAKKLMQAHLLEMRLYQDEPGLLFRAQWRLIVSNGRYVAHMLRPAAFLALPMVILFAHFDSVYGRRPLVGGESALLVVDTDLLGADLSLTASDGFEVDSVSVSAPTAGQVVWRVRATRDGTGEFTLDTPAGDVTKQAVAGERQRYVSATRSNSWWERLLLAPGEGRFDPVRVGAVSIAYPAREVGIGALETHWVVWFLAISILSAFLLKGFFGIVL